MQPVLLFRSPAVSTAAAPSRASAAGPGNTYRVSVPAGFRRAGNVVQFEQRSAWFAYLETLAGYGYIVRIDGTRDSSISEPAD